MTDLTRRAALKGAVALGAAASLPLPARASGSLNAAIYPGTWDEAYRAIVAPQLKAKHGVDVAFDTLWAVDQVTKVRAARGVPPFDCFVLDPGPAAAARQAGLFDPIDASKLTNASKLPAGMITADQVTVNVQVVGICYNPKKIPNPPKTWAQLFESPFVERLGLTGFQTTFGTVSLVEMAKASGFGHGYRADLQEAEGSAAQGCGGLHAGGSAGPVPAGADRHHVHQHQQRRDAEGARRGYRLSRSGKRRHHVLDHASHREGLGEPRCRAQIHRHGDRRRCAIEAPAFALQHDPREQGREAFGQPRHQVAG